MGRHKMKDLEIIKGHDFIATPMDLTAKEAEIFERIVSSYAPSHFIAGDVEMLKNYCKNYILLEQYNKQLRLTPILSKEHKHCVELISKISSVQANLGTKLRVVPNSRMARTDSATVLNDTQEHDEFADL